MTPSIASASFGMPDGCHSKSFELERVVDMLESRGVLQNGRQNDVSVAIQRAGRILESKAVPLHGRQNDASVAPERWV